MKLSIHRAARGVRARLDLVGAASLVMILWALPVAAYLLVRNDGPVSERRATTTRTAALVRVGSRTDDGSFAASISIVQAAPGQVLATQSGMVTWLNTAAVGSQLVDGMRVAGIDGRIAYGHLGAIPFYRRLAEGDQGADVSELKALLARLRLLSADTSDLFDARTTAAVERLQASGNWPATGVFLPAMTVFVPTRFGTLASFSVGLGDTVGAGQPLGVSEPIPTGVVIAAADPSSPFDIGSGPVVFRAGDATLSVSSVRPRPTDLSKIERFLVTAAENGTVTVVQPSGGSQPITQYAGVTVAREVPVVSGAVPASALYTTQTGTTCVFVRSEDSDALVAAVVPASISPSSEIGVANIQPTLVGREVVVDATTLSTTATKQCK